jgi:hypothetical protein
MFHKCQSCGGYNTRVLSHIEPEEIDFCSTADGIQERAADTRQCCLGCDIIHCHSETAMQLCRRRRLLFEDTQAPSMFQGLFEATAQVIYVQMEYIFGELG